MLPALIGSQDWNHSSVLNYDIVIQLGEVTGNYYQLGIGFCAKEVWRVNEDGLLKDTFKKLRYVFEVRAIDFFNHYSENVNGKKTNNTIFRLCDEEYNKTFSIMRHPAACGVFLCGNKHNTHWVLC